MAVPNIPAEPSLPWRIGSSSVMGVTGFLCRAFTFGANSAHVHGLDSFLYMLEERKDPRHRRRGLITVSNHVSVYVVLRSIDDPLMWGFLPYRYHFNPSNHRWSLGSYDLCFTNKFLSAFFTFGQVLPTHRHHKSDHGGLFQPTMTQAIRLLSNPTFRRYQVNEVEKSSAADQPDGSIFSPDLSDPFSSPHLTYSTNGSDTFPAPSAYSSRKHSWIHVFPEGRVHQHPQKTMRYFKWGVARLILEPDECPDIVPIWIEGNEQVMHESRKWPRFLPRVGKKLGIWFGDNVGGDQESVFNELRRKWQELVKRDRQRRNLPGQWDELGVLSEEMKYGKEAMELRMECTKRVRQAVLQVRRLRGLPDEDPKEGLVETWREEGGKREGRMGDGSWVKDT